MTGYVFVNMWWPNDKADEAGKIFLKIAATLPKFLKRVSESPWFWGDENGYQAYVVYETEEAKMFDALKELARYYANYRVVPGLRFRILPVMTAKDAMPMIGLAPPALK